MIHTGEQLKQIVSDFLDGDTYVVFWYDKTDVEYHVEALTQNDDEHITATEWENVADELNHFGQRELDSIFDNAIDSHVKRDY